MANRIMISPEQLKQRAREYGNSSNQINQILKNLQTLQDNLRAEWEGEAFKGFDEQFLQLKPKVQQFAELMLKINQQLDKTADIMVENDQKLKSGFGLQQK